MGISHPFPAQAWRGDGAAALRATKTMDQPLLAWDLSVFLVAVATLWPRRDLALVGDSSMTARLAQYLLKPPEVGNFDDDTCDPLNALDAVLRSGARLPPRPSGGVSARKARDAVKTFQNVVDLVLGALGGPTSTPLDVEAIARTPSVVLLAEKWATRFGDAYGDAPVGPADRAAAAPECPKALEADDAFLLGDAPERPQLFGEGDDDSVAPPAAET